MTSPVQETSKPSLGPHQNPQLLSPPPSPRSNKAEIDVEQGLSDSGLYNYPPGPEQPQDAAVAYASGDGLRPSTSRDPLLLMHRVQSPETIQELRRRGRKGKPMEEFYTTQNEHITSMLKTLDEDAEDGQADAAEELRVRIAIRASFIVNCLLACLQLYAAISSLSLSFFATALDAVFDPAANFALNWTHRYSAKVDPQKYPAGGSRFENVGNIVYSGVMQMVSVVLVVECIRQLAGKDFDKQFHLPATIAVSIAFAAKLALFLYCMALRNVDKQVRVLWEDHRNDLFINGFGIFTNAAGAKLVGWLDPAGALIISLVLIFVWGDTIRNEFKQLAGQSAPVDFLQRVIYKAMVFSDRICAIDSCKVYHVGPQFFVEIDIVMDGQTLLHEAHDVAQLLQDKIEQLPEVSRCFVHIDHEVTHKPEHAKKL